MEKGKVDKEELMENILTVDYDEDKHCFIFMMKDGPDIEAYIK